MVHKRISNLKKASQQIDEQINKTQALARFEWIIWDGVESL